MKFGRAGIVFAGHRGKFNKFDIENHKLKNPDLCIFGKCYIIQIIIS